MTDRTSPETLSAKLLQELERTTYVVFHGPNWTLGLGNAEQRTLIDALRSFAVAQTPTVTEDEIKAYWHERMDKAQDRIKELEAALKSAFRELKQHDADYHHRTQVSIDNLILAALSDTSTGRK